MSTSRTPPRHEVVITRDGARAIRDTHLREVMHPVVGARTEAEQLYARQSRLLERLGGERTRADAWDTNDLVTKDNFSKDNHWDTTGFAERGPGPLVLFDVGLGAGSNALAARSISESLAAGAGGRALAWREGWAGSCEVASPPSSAGASREAAPARGAPRGRARRLCLVSFENDLGALELALQPEHASDFGLEGEPGEAARALLERGEHRTARTHWLLRKGDLLARLEEEPLRAELVFWDPFSPRANPALWSTTAFTLLRARCAPGCTLFTYAAATSVRAALLLAGFAVGIGAATGTTQETTAAACDARDLARPLDARWLQRLARSSAPFPADAPPDALERIRAAPQFR